MAESACTDDAIHRVLRNLYDCLLYTSLNYEWNFGISAGWKPYDNDYNSYNGAVGSRVNAYLNAGIYLNWSLSRYFDFIIGGDFTHFSNGNTKFPNAGVNTTGAKIGLVYNLSLIHILNLLVLGIVNINPYPKLRE